MNRIEQIDTLYDELQAAMDTCNAMPEQDALADKVFVLLQQARDLVFDAQLELQ